MNIDDLIETATALVGRGKGLLAADESTGTANKRFAAAGIPQTVEARRTYRDVLFSTPDIADCISGIILFDETIRQQALDGRPFPKVLADIGIMPGIKLDLGAKPLAGHPGETVTEGLDGLRERLKEYVDLGARFAKWRAVITIADGLPTQACLDVNAHALARYAALCQEAGVVPIVEPEVIMTGDHDIERCAKVTEAGLRSLFAALEAQGVVLEGTILKPNMVLPGLSCAVQATPERVAEATVTSLSRTVPAAVAGIAFLSGGQSAELASARLNAMHRPDFRLRSRMPWPVTFSYARALHQPALEAWRGLESNRAVAQSAFLHRARCNLAALSGNYHPDMDRA